MLQKSERLTKKLFDEYFKRGKRFHFTHCSIIFSAHDSLHASVVVGKKVAKKAVNRNTLRRRVYGQLYRTLKLNNHTGIYIVLLKPTFATLPRQQAATELATNIASLLKKT